MMKRSLIVWVTILFAGANVFSQEKFQTVAEKSDYKSTSDYEDVMTFIDQLKKSSDYIRVENIATSVEGREIPLLIIGNPLPKSPKDLANDKRIVVYVQANIHAGEVEGKEATLMYARDLLKDKNPGLFENVVLLICPLFNPDGNEKISPLNRTNQNGPVNGVGVRYNGQFLDLNRDAMKAESPEVRGVLTNVFNRWDPSVFMDCHTTNGSYHVEPVTFTWMVNPNGDNSLISYMRDKMMPEMSKALFNKHKVENCFYGEFYDMMDPEKGWVLDASEPRYMSNYFGIRNRLGILNENYVYSDFRSRVLGCYYLINSLLDYASTHNAEILNLLKDVDSRTIARGISPAVTDSFAVEYKVRPAPEKVTVKTFEADLVTDANGRRSYKKSDRQRNVTIPYYIDYFPTKSVRLPFAYLVTTSDPEIIGLLMMHGIKVEKLTKNSRIEVLRFEISELKGAARLNQGHYTNTVKGRYLKETTDFPAGTIVVRTAQPLANVAAYLLEPQSNDGMLTWNFFDRYLIPQWGMGYNLFPVYKIMDCIDLKTNPVL
ncbi:MAG: M14 family metallopeptidase [Bacteroidota bacterium]